MMSKFIVRGGNKLTGSVKVSGAKNSVLPIIAASLLGEEGVSVIHDAPPLDDVITISKVLESIGAGITYDNNVMRVDAQAISSCEAPYEWVRKMRASFLVMGPLLARMGHTRISLPGGCAIGTRPIDQHLKGFEALGARSVSDKVILKRKSTADCAGLKSIWMWQA
ncbi:UDP-N-acetylglucosamine 1-carboxyvinyltransferase 1 [Paenibacillus sp. P1XP2]|nr:UDP-N-acetylglucosamine 1-carboxyvinyltransferase 1 [Paenibacillus sp. P1XP2]